MLYVCYEISKNLYSFLDVSKLSTFLVHPVEKILTQAKRTKTISTARKSGLKLVKLYKVWLRNVVK